MATKKKSGKGKKVVKLQRPKARSKKRARDVRLPGMEIEVHKDIERAAERYVEARDQLMAMTKVEVDRRAVLTAAMKEHKLTRYPYDGRVVTLDVTEKLKVRSSDEEEGEPVFAEEGSGEAASVGEEAEGEAEEV